MFCMLKGLKICFRTLYRKYYTLFFYKNIFYKNIEAEICEILRIKLRLRF